MNDLQAIQFDMLKTFWQICERLDLHPYLICGSALGAAKYQGFIPWDDDLDIALPRPEYECFLREAPALLPDDLFVQNARTDPAFPQLYSKLRKNGTAFIEARAAHLPIHHGIYIDLFPLDGIPQSKPAAWILHQRMRLCRLKLLCAYGKGGSRKERALRRLGRMLGWHRRTAQTILHAERLISRYDASVSLLWCCHGNWRVSHDCVPTAQYGDGHPALFEGMTARIPAQFDSYLTQRYGDWRAELPADQKHGRAAVIDLHSDRLWRQP